MTWGKVTVSLPKLIFLNIKLYPKWFYSFYTTMIFHLFISNIMENIRKWIYFLLYQIETLVPFLFFPLSLQVIKTNKKKPQLWMLHRNHSSKNQVYHTNDYFSYVKSQHFSLLEFDYVGCLLFKPLCKLFL